MLVLIDQAILNVSIVIVVAYFSLDNLIEHPFVVKSKEKDASKTLQNVKVVII